MPAMNQPTTCAELAAVLESLPALSPVDRIRVLRQLEVVTRTIYADEAALAMLEATTGPHAKRPVDLADELGFDKNKVTKARKRVEQRGLTRGEPQHARGADKGRVQGHAPVASRQAADR
jgi:hypothetical protein